MQRPHSSRIGVTAAALAAALLSWAAAPSATAAEADTRASAPIRFQVTATTQWGEQVFAVGSVPALGSWDPARAVPLDAHGYPRWDAEAVVPTDAPVEYKYLVKKTDGTVTWEDGANRYMQPRAGGAPVTTRDAFRVTAGIPASGIAPTCISWSETWRYTPVFNGCGSTYGLQVIYRDGSISTCRQVAAAATATFAGYGPYENRPVAVNHC
ncbi:carbohydrate-binding module family 20 domain-containing protein [Streptomyces sp. NPDC059650]|uniref:carbohydrate-binding module family 20 domain-containing protein n=1 Tax=Streptomyces sp. NPDC059650 TaxID=3346896 RepID=UPI0036CA50A7